MSEPTSAGTVCPACSAPATGRFCASCGTPLQASICTACSTPLGKGARFCHRCGKPADGTTATSPRTATSSPAGGKSARWLAATIAVVAVLAWFAGRAIKPADPATGMPQGVQLGGPGPDGSGNPVRAPDISQLSPEERAERLYNRVMLLGQQGKTDSVLFFAPMAIDAYRMMGTLDERRKAELDRIVQAADAAAAGTRERESK